MDGNELLLYTCTPCSKPSAQTHRKASPFLKFWSRDSAALPRRFKQMIGSRHTKYCNWSRLDQLAGMDPVSVLLSARKLLRHDYRQHARQTLKSRPKTGSFCDTRACVPKGAPTSDPPRLLRYWTRCHSVDCCADSPICAATKQQKVTAASANPRQRESEAVLAQGQRLTLAQSPRTLPGKESLAEGCSEGRGPCMFVQRGKKSKSRRADLGTPDADVREHCASPLQSRASTTA
jgi:hypothetical protein